MKSLINEILNKYWGYTSFRDLQEDIILSVLEGNDTLGLLPTGGGKSVTFQVPTLALDGMAVVITPIISLMKDQVDNLKSKGIKAIYIHSGLSGTEMRNAIDKCIYGKYKFLYISPERLNSDGFIDKLRLMKVSLIVVDEAHCISQWGYDFRPSYLSISKTRNLFPKTPLLALTATATPDVVSDIMENLNFRNGKVFSKSFSRENLSYIVRSTDDKIKQLTNILSKLPGSGIVYVRNRRKTKEISDELNRNNICSDFYHAGLNIEDKESKQNKWKNNECRIIVATNAFGMGIDKPDVRIVIHADVPSSLEEYYQEAGRAGRDGKKAYVVLLISNSDKSVLKRRITDSFPAKDFIKTIYEYLCNYLGVALESGYNELYDFNFDMFCKTFRFPVIPALNALKILTQSGYIEFVEEIETQSRVMILATKEELYNLSTSNPDLDKVLQAILRNYTGLFADYVFINEDLISRRFNLPAETIYNSLLTLTKMHILHYIPRKRTPYVIFTTSRELPKHVIISKESYEIRKERLERRIKAVTEYAFFQGKCRENILLNYFGEVKNDSCGKCDVCLDSKNKLTGKSATDIKDGIIYLLKNNDRTLHQIIETLSFPKEHIISVVRELIDEGTIIEESPLKYRIKK